MIRPATIEDAAAVAEVLVRTWHTGYKGLVPDAYLATVVLDEAKIERSRKWVREPGELRSFVALADEVVVGFACGGPQREAGLPFAGELYALYVLAEHQRIGHGRALARSVASDLAARGMTSMSVWVFERGPGRGFYERLGGQRLEARKDREFSGTKLAEIAFGWSDLRMLVAS